MMTNGVDLSELTLPIGPSSELAVERYAREYCNVHPRSNLAIMYGIASVGVCVAAQGGWVLQAPIKGGGHLEVPVIQHFMGVAPSGWRKSTALDAARKPLNRVLAKGVRHRMEISSTMRRNAEAFARENADPGAPAFDPKQFAAVFNAGLCQHTTMKDPTPEAIRDFLVNNGGVAAIWSAEGDAYRNLSAYNKPGDTGSLSMFLDGWGQENIETARVGRGMISIDTATLLQTVLFQSDVFAEVTGGGRAGGADSFVSRGMFGRIWVVRATEVGGFEALAQEYCDEDDFTADGVDGMEVMGEKSQLGWALFDYENALTDLVRESDAYRAHKAMRRAWELQRTDHGTALQVPEVNGIERHVIHLNAEARLAYRRVQRLQLAIEAALYADGVDEDTRAVFNPLAARITQHVLREAIVIALGSGYRTVSGQHIEDAATRLLPWRIAHTADALLMRADELATDQLAKLIKENPRREDRTARAIVMKVVAQMTAELPEPLRDAGIGRFQIRERVLNMLPKDQQGSVGSLTDRILSDLVGTPGSGLRMAAASADAPHGLGERYAIDQDSLARYLR
jgi:hypothetical protein